MPRAATSPPHHPTWVETLRSGRRFSLRSARYRAPSSGFFKDLPSVDITTGVHSQHPCATRSRTACSRRRRALLPSCGLMEPSASRSHAGDSFRLRGFSPPCRIAPPEAHRLVASCSQPWGSPCFRARPDSESVPRASPPVPLPSRAFPASTAVPTSPSTVALLTLQVAPRLAGPAVFKALLRGSVRCPPAPLPACEARCSPGLPFAGASTSAIPMPLHPSSQPSGGQPWDRKPASVRRVRRGCCSRSGYRPVPVAPVLPTLRCR
jgi:hypothetical protein